MLGPALWSFLLVCCAIGYVLATNDAYPPMDVCRPEYESPRTAFGFFIAAGAVVVYLGGAIWLRRRGRISTWVVVAGAVGLLLLASYVVLPTGSC